MLQQSAQFMEKAFWKMVCTINICIYLMEQRI